MRRIDWRYATDMGIEPFLGAVNRVMTFGACDEAGLGIWLKDEDET